MVRLAGADVFIVIDFGCCTHVSQRSRFRWGLGPPLKVKKASSMAPLEDRKNTVEQWKRDRERWADHGFKVLGVEIGHLPEHQQVALLAGGVFFFLLIYGYMQVTAALVACGDNLPARWTEYILVTFTVGREKSCTIGSADPFFLPYA